MVIAPVSHVLMSWLKLYALANVPRIVVTSPVSHPLMSWLKTVVVHQSDHNRVMVAQVDYHIRAEQSINGKETTEYIHKVSMI